MQTEERLTAREIFAVILMVSCPITGIVGTVMAIIKASWIIFWVWGIGIPLLLFVAFMLVLGLNPFKRKQ